MIASQIAARWFLHRYRLDREARFLRLMPMADRLGSLAPDARTACLQQVDDGIDYDVLLHADQLAESTPLFWGDLLHMRQYLNAIRGLLSGSAATPEDLLLLKSSPMDVVRRAVSFGTTLLYHSASDLADKEYGPCLRRFVGNARCIMPRDIVSFAQLAAIDPESTFHLGLDATQLFCGEADWRTAFPDGTDTSCASPDVVLCAFARGRHDVSDLRQAIGLFATGFGLPVHWLPWGDSLSFPHLGSYSGHLGLDTVSPVARPCLSALLEAVAAARCVLTDIYHVAVLAWSLGTPAMLIRGDHWPEDYNAVIDKRYVFYVQHGLQEFFLETARDHGALAAFIRRGVGLVAEGKVLELYRASVSQRAKTCEKRLCAVLAEGMGRA